MPKKIDLNGSSRDLMVSVEVLQASVDRYKNERHDLLPGEKRPDSRAVWISRNKIMEFLSSNPDASGMRIYFGVIEDDNFGPHYTAHNLVFVPTTQGTEGNDDLTGDNDWVIVTQNFNASEKGGAMPLDASSPECAICPPPDPCTGRSLNFG